MAKLLQMKGGKLLVDGSGKLLMGEECCCGGCASCPDMTNFVFPKRSRVQTTFVANESSVRSGGYWNDTAYMYGNPCWAGESGVSFEKGYTEHDDLTDNRTVTADIVFDATRTYSLTSKAITEYNRVELQVGTVVSGITVVAFDAAAFYTEFSAAYNSVYVYARVAGIVGSGWTLTVGVGPDSSTFWWTSVAESALTLSSSTVDVPLGNNAGMTIRVAMSGIVLAEPTSAQTSYQYLLHRPVLPAMTATVVYEGLRAVAVDDVLYSGIIYTTRAGQIGTGNEATQCKARLSVLDTEVVAPLDLETVLVANYTRCRITFGGNYSIPIGINFDIDESGGSRSVATIAVVSADIQCEGSRVAHKVAKTGYGTTASFTSGYTEVYCESETTNTTTCTARAPENITITCSYNSTYHTVGLSMTFADANTIIECSGSEWGSTYSSVWDGNGYLLSGDDHNCDGCSVSNGTTSTGCNYHPDTARENYPATDAACICGMGISCYPTGAGANCFYGIPISGIIHYEKSTSGSTDLYAECTDADTNSMVSTIANTYETYYRSYNEFSTPLISWNTGNSVGATGFEHATKVTTSTTDPETWESTSTDVCTDSVNVGQGAHTSHGEYNVGPDLYSCNTATLLLTAVE